MLKQDTLFYYYIYRRIVSRNHSPLVIHHPNKTAFYFSYREDSTRPNQTKPHPNHTKRVKIKTGPISSSTTSSSASLAPYFDFNPTVAAGRDSLSPPIQIPTDPNPQFQPDMEKTTSKPHHNTLILTYGTLKQGFSNHGLMQDLIRTNDASYIGPYTTHERYPLVTGPYKVPFLLNFPGRGERVCGEVYAVSRQGLARLDELEGITKGHYERRPITVVPCDDDDDGGQGVSEFVSAEAYFAHVSYAMDLWRKSGERGYVAYSEKEAKGYVRRVDRPTNLSFLQQIQAFVGE